MSIHGAAKCANTVVCFKFMHAIAAYHPDLFFQALLWRYRRVLLRVGARGKTRGGSSSF
jgi:hypothetical protein